MLLLQIGKLCSVKDIQQVFVVMVVVVHCCCGRSQWWSLARTQGTVQQRSTQERALLLWCQLNTDSTQELYRRRVGTLQQCLHCRRYHRSSRRRVAIVVVVVVGCANMTTTGRVHAATVGGGGRRRSRFIAKGGGCCCCCCIGELVALCQGLQTQIGGLELEQLLLTTVLFLQLLVGLLQFQLFLANLLFQLGVPRQGKGRRRFGTRHRHGTGCWRRRRACQE